MITCRKCREDKPQSDYATYARRDRVCRQCICNATKARRNATVAKRLLYNLQQTCREHRWPEGALWTVDHVDQLLSNVVYPPAVVEGIKQGMRPR